MVYAGDECHDWMQLRANKLFFFLRFFWGGNKPQGRSGKTQKEMNETQADLRLNEAKIDMLVVQ